MTDKPDRVTESVVEWGLGSLLLRLQGIAELHPNEQPHFPGGVRPFGTGDLKYYIGVLTAALEALTARPQSGAVERARQTIAQQPDDLTLEQVTAQRDQWIITASDLQARLTAALNAAALPVEGVREARWARWLDEASIFLHDWRSRFSVRVPVRPSPNRRIK